MPLTPSHAAAALPLRLVLPGLPLSALVIGTLSPDFEYLLRLAPRSSISHTPGGLFVFCLPAGLFAWLIFSLLVRPAVLSLLPDGLASTLEAVSPGKGTQRLVLAAVAVLLGAATHVIWDGFTHATGWAVVALPALSRPIGSLGPPLFKVAQHASTLIGATILLVWMVVWVRRHDEADRRFAPGQARRTLTVTLVLLMTAGLAGIANGLVDFEHGLVPGLGHTAVGGMIGLAVGLVGFGVLHRLHRSA